MKPKVLFIISNYNLYGGTPKKTLELMEFFGDQSVLYVYGNYKRELKGEFEATGGKIYEGFYGWNLLRHARKLLDIVDKEKIDLVNTQFNFGEVLGALIKQFRSNIKLVVAFVAPFKPPLPKETVLRPLYYKVDSFIYISNYVERCKKEQFSILKKKPGRVIYNGTSERVDNKKDVPEMGSPSLLSVAALLEWKNLQVVIKAMNILVNKRGKSDIRYYIVGEGGAHYKPVLLSMIEKYNLSNNVFLLGYQKNIGRLLNDCDIFVHPSYKEGFGIAVAEAMHAGKPLIVSNEGALPELIDNQENGLVVAPHSPDDWSEAILSLLTNPRFATEIGKKAKLKAKNSFSYEQFIDSYNNFYEELLRK